MQSLSTLELAYCAVVLVVSYALRGSTGFGGFVAMPLMALVLPMKLLVPVWTLLTIASSITIVGKERRHVGVIDIARMAPGCLLGIGIGLAFFKSLDSEMLARGFGALVIGYGVYSLWAATRAPSRWHGAPRTVATVAGTLGGIVGTVFGNMASLAFAVYFDALKINKERFRATMSAMMLMLSLVRGVGYYAVGEFEWQAVIVFALSLPPMLLGIFIGDRVHANISDLAFKRMVCAVLIASGVPLMIK